MMATKKPAKKMTAAEDRRLDKRAGIKEGSARDNALDKRRGVPMMKGKSMKKGNC